MEIIEYEESMGKIKFIDSRFEILQGLPMEEQAQRFKVEVEVVDWDNIYGERIVNDCSTYVVDVEECPYARKWIVKDGIIVGVAFNDEHDALRYLFLDDRCTTYHRWDKNGIGGHHLFVTCTLVW